MRLRMLLAGLILASGWLFGGSLTGCGPIQYITNVTFRAERLIEEAKVAEAKKYAPYEWWSAVTYLRMAREKVGYADHQAAAGSAEVGEEFIHRVRTSLQGSRQGHRSRHRSPLSDLWCDGASLWS